MGKVRFGGMSGPEMSVLEQKRQLPGWLTGSRKRELVQLEMDFGFEGGEGDKALHAQSRAYEWDDLEKNPRFHSRVR